MAPAAELRKCTVEGLCLCCVFQGLSFVIELEVKLEASRGPQLLTALNFRLKHVTPTVLGKQCAFISYNLCVCKKRNLFAYVVYELTSPVLIDPFLHNRHIDRVPHCIDCRSCAPLGTCLWFTAPSIVCYTQIRDASGFKSNWSLFLSNTSSRLKSKV